MQCFFHPFKTEFQNSQEEKQLGNAHFDPASSAALGLGVMFCVQIRADRLHAGNARSSVSSF